MFGIHTRSIGPQAHQTSWGGWSSANLNQSHMFWISSLSSVLQHLATQRSCMGSVALDTSTGRGGPLNTQTGLATSCSEIGKRSNPMWLVHAASPFLEYLGRGSRGSQLVEHLLFAEVTSAELSFRGSPGTCDMEGGSTSCRQHIKGGGGKDC